MKRLMPLVSIAALVACADEAPMGPGAPEDASPAFLVESYSAGGVSLSAASGCTYSGRPNRFVCDYEVSGLPPGLANVGILGEWSVLHQCLHHQTRKPNPRGSAVGQLQKSVVPHSLTPSVDGQLSGRNVKVPVPTERDEHNFVCQTEPYTLVRFLEEPKAIRWTIMAQWALDVNNYFAILREDVSNP